MKKATITTLTPLEGTELELVEEFEIEVTSINLKLSPAVAFWGDRLVGPQLSQSVPSSRPDAVGVEVDLVDDFMVAR